MQQDERRQVRVPLSSLPIERDAVMIDGLHIDDHVVLVALGVDEEARKHVLGLWQGATENSSVCKALLNNLVGRGLDTQRSLLFVIDGSPALRKAIRTVFDGPQQVDDIHPSRAWDLAHFNVAGI